jgi:hypothetical protein
MMRPELPHLTRAGPSAATSGVTLRAQSARTRYPEISEESHGRTVTAATFITLLGASADGHLREDVGGKAGVRSV